MTTLANDNDNETTPPNGAFADGLTLIRVILTPIIMFIIVKAWSAKAGDPSGFVSLDLSLVLLASILFVVAALTDIADDFIGGSAHTKGRLLGWFDDIADSVLVAGTLLALTWVIYKAGLLHWLFAVPVTILIVRDIIIWLTKRGSLLETRLGDIKSALAMLGTCILVATPWLSNIVDGFRANGAAEKAVEIYNNASPLVWNCGLTILWIAALLSLLTGFKILTSKTTNPVSEESTIS